MLGWFRKLLPREERFDLFARHSQQWQGAEALEGMMRGDETPVYCQRVNRSKRRRPDHSKFSPRSGGRHYPVRSR